MFQHIPKILGVTWPRPSPLMENCAYFYSSLPRSSSVTNLKCLCSLSLVLQPSHAHTVVWECSKDDHQSQLGMAKFDHQSTLNPWTNRHQIWNAWLCRGYLPPKNTGRSAHGFLPPTYVKYIPKTFECLLLFSRFIRAPRDALVLPTFAVNMSYDVVLRKEVPFGGEKI